MYYDPVIGKFHCHSIVLKIPLFSMLSSHERMIGIFHCLFIAVKILLLSVLDPAPLVTLQKAQLPANNFPLRCTVANRKVNRIYRKQFSHFGAPQTRKIMKRYRNQVCDKSCR